MISSIRCEALTQRYTRCKHDAIGLKDGRAVCRVHEREGQPLIELTVSFGESWRRCVACGSTWTLQPLCVECLQCGIERRFVRWLLTRLRGARSEVTVPDGSRARVDIVFGGWAIEAKMRPNAHAIGQSLTYGRLLNLRSAIAAPRDAVSDEFRAAAKKAGVTVFRFAIPSAIRDFKPLRFNLSNHTDARVFKARVEALDRRDRGVL